MTEPDYFNILKKLINADGNETNIVILPSNKKSSPLYVLNRLKTALNKYAYSNPDGAWLVVDKDNWTDEKLDPLWSWAKSNKKYGLAVSNPCFEYWLLLHFEEGNGLSSKDACERHLKRHIPEYDKSLRLDDIGGMDEIRNAVRRADLRDRPRCEKWPDGPAGTTVYRLVRKIIGD